jgi:hypothetical protein
MNVRIYLRKIVGYISFRKLYDKIDIKNKAISLKEKEQ